MKRAFINTVLILSFLSLLYSCNRLHYPNRQDLVSLNSASALNGYFKNLSNDTSKISMWRVLAMTDRYKKTIFEYDKPNSYVQLIGKDNRSIVAKLFVDSILTAEKTFKGKIKDDYFIVRRKIKYRGVPFIIGVESDCKLQFSKDSLNNIYIDDTYSSIGWIFIMAAGAHGDGNYKYMMK